MPKKENIKKKSNKEKSKEANISKTLNIQNKSSIISSDIKSDFIKQFTFYLAIVLGLTVIAYVLAILPSLISKQQFSYSNQSLNQLLANASSQSLNQSIQLEEYKCKDSLTENSKWYNVKYKIFSNGSEIGFIEYTIKKIEKESNYQEMNNLMYERTMVYYLNISRLPQYSANASISNTNANFQLSDYLVKTITLYNKDFQCLNSSLVMEIGGQNYSQPYYCYSPDVPTTICRENLTIINTTQIKTDAGHFNITLYKQNYEANPMTSSSSFQTLGFADLPFLIIMEDSDTRLELVNYSKIE